MRHKSEELMKQIMDYAEQFQLLNHRSPYTSEIADALGIVKSTVYKYLVAMNDRGMLSYRNGEIVTERTNKISLLTKPAAVLGSVSCGMPQLEEEYNESTLKRFFLDTERRCVRLHPENLKYPDIYTQNCTVQGVAVHVIKSLE